MSAEEEIVNKLFEQARNEAIETNINDIQKWIGLVTLGAVLIGLLAKMKLVFTKSTAMYATAILTVGIGLGTYFLSGTENSPKQQQVPIDKTVIKQGREIQLKDDILSMPPAPKEAARLLPKELPAPESTRTEELPEIPIELPIRRPTQDKLFPDYSLISTSGNEEDYGTFQALKLAGAVDVVITQGTKESVNIEADEKGKSLLVIKNKNGTLEIYTENKKNVSDFKLKVYVTVVNLEKIECSSAVDLSSKGGLNFNNFELKSSGASDVKLDLNATEVVLNISGASDVDLKLTAKKVSSDISGASDIVLSGSAAYLDLVCTGASDLKAEKLKVQEGKIKCSGASIAKLYITEKLDLTVSGASDVKYKGRPSIGIKSVTGASKVRQF